MSSPKYSYAYLSLNKLFINSSKDFYYYEVGFTRIIFIKIIVQLFSRNHVKSTWKDCITSIAHVNANAKTKQNTSNEFNIICLGGKITNRPYTAAFNKIETYQFIYFYLFFISYSSAPVHKGGILRWNIYMFLLI